MMYQSMERYVNQRVAAYARRDFYSRVFDLVIENHTGRKPHIAVFRRDSLVTRYHLLGDWKSPTCGGCGSAGFVYQVPSED